MYKNTKIKLKKSYCLLELYKVIKNYLNGLNN